MRFEQFILSRGIDKFYVGQGQWGQKEAAKIFPTYETAKHFITVRQFKDCTIMQIPNPQRIRGGVKQKRGSSRYHF